MVMERNFQRGRKLEGSGRRKNRVEVSQNKKKKKKEKEGSTLPQRGCSLVMYRWGGRALSLGNQ